jgi:uncharacterized coiled-coil DUF342 family protein
LIKRKGWINRNNVIKIHKMQEREKEQILRKIQEDDQRADHIKQERAQLLQVRKQMRIEVDLMKSEMSEYFEKIQMNKASLDGANDMMQEFSKKFDSKHAQLETIANSHIHKDHSPSRASSKLSTTEKKPFRAIKRVTLIIFTV